MNVNMPRRFNRSTAGKVDYNVVNGLIGPLKERERKEEKVRERLPPPS